MTYQPRYITALAVLLTSFVPVTFSQGVLEEIIVTAQKREQSLQDVPISVNAYGGEFIKNTGIERLEDLAAIVPTVTVTTINTADRITIRGVGSGTNLGFEQSVGTFIDGVYFGRDQHSRNAFFDLERIEVLRGPQSTFFGNNTIGGALSISTRKPSDEFEGFAKLGWNPGEEDDLNLELAAGGPLTDTLKVRAAIMYSDSEGFINNVALGRTDPSREVFAGRITAVWEPTDRFDATLKVEYMTDEQLGHRREIDHCPPPAPLTPGLGCGLGLGPGQAFGFEGRVNDVSAHASFNGVGPNGSLTEFAESDSQLYQLTMNYDLDSGHTLTSVSAFTEFDLDRVSDIDNTPFSIVTVSDPTDYEQFSQELRLTSPTGEEFEYIAGLYWQTEDLVIREILNISPFFYEQTNPFSQESESFSVFGALTWNISDVWRATVGLRYTDVEKDLERIQRVYNPATGLTDPGSLGTAAFLGTVPHPLTSYSRNDDDLTPSFNVQYDVNEDVMVYFSFSQGFKAGGFDHRSGPGDPAALAFEPEEVDAYEIGAKTTWLDGALQFNIAAFRSEYENLQVSVFSGNGITFFVDNAATSISQGIEVDARWAITENLTMNAAASYLDATYDEFPVGPCHFFNTPTTPSCTAPPFGIDFAGKLLPYAPEWSGTINLNHAHQFNNGWELNSQLTATFTDEFFTRVNLDPRVLQSGYAKLDARIALSGGSLARDGDNWELAVLGKNLTDKDTFPLSGGVALSPEAVLRFRDRQRYFLIQASYGW